MTGRRVLMVSSLLLAGCGGQVRELRERNEVLGKKVVETQQEVETLQARKVELDSQISDLEAKLKAGQARIDELAKSNADLSQSMKSGQGELSAKLAKLVGEKDELSRKVNELQKEKISADRARATLLSRREKLTAELAAARQELEQAQPIVAADKKRQEERSARLAKAREDLGAVADAVLKAIQQEKASIEQSGDAVLLTLQEPLLFEPQQAKLTDAGHAALDRLGQALYALGPRQIRVQGHSDNAAIKWELFGRFTSHWDLTAARAIAVARYFHEHSGLDPRHLAAEGYGEFRPIKPNVTAEGRSANRRIVLVIEPAL